MNTFRPHALVIAILALTGCNSNNHDQTTTASNNTAVATQTITITPSLGKISNARVVLRNAATQQTLGSSQPLNSNGQAVFTVPQSSVQGQPIVAEVLPASTGDVTYIDETDNLSHTITINSSNRNTPLLRAAVAATAATTEIGVTALTEAAYRQLPSTTLNVAEAIQAINTANTTVRNQLGLSYDIYTAPVLDYNQLINTSIQQTQRAYAAYLAALAKQAAQLNTASTTPAYDIAQALASDLADKTFDGSANGQALALAYNNAFVTEWVKVAAAIVSQIQTWTTTAALNTYFDSVKTTINNAGGYTPTQGTGPKILHPAMIKTYNAKVSQSTNGIPARTPCSVSLAADGVLSVLVAGQTYRVTIPSDIIDADSDMTKDGNRIKAVTSYTTTWGGRAHASNYGIGWAHYTSSNTADGPVSTSVLTYNSGVYGSTQVVCDTYSITGGAASLGDGAKGAVEVGSDGSFKAEAVTAETVAAGRRQVWTDLGYGSIAVTYGTSDKTISAINVTHSVTNRSFSCEGTTACAGASFSTINNVPVLVLNNVNVTGSSSQKLNGVLVEADNANTPPANTNSCSSNGADNKLGFAGAPNDFCSFSSNTASVSNNTYIFSNLAGETVSVTVTDGVVTGVSAEQGAKYGFVCSSAIGTPCTGITITNSGSDGKQFTFQNTVLKGVTGSSANLTITGGNLIKPTSTNNNTSGSCSGNNSPYGCLTITGANAPASFFVHIGSPLLFNGGPQVQSAVAHTGAITYFGAGAAANSVNAGLSVGYQKIVGNTQNAIYTFQQFDAIGALATNLRYRCKDANNTCTGLSVDEVAKSITFDNVVMFKLDINDQQTSESITVNGTMTY